MPGRDWHAGARRARPGEGAQRPARAPAPTAGSVTPGREGVAHVQRARLLAALIEVANERGVANITVTHVVSRAGVSRRTFYEAFDGCEDCFMAAVDEALACAARYVAGACEPREPWRPRIRAGLAALLAFVEEEPAMGRLLVVETLGAGRRVSERRAEVLAGLIAIVDAGREEAKASVEPLPLTAEGLVGAVLSVIHARLAEGGGEPVTQLTNALMSMLVLPYLGHAAARRELARQLPQPSARRARPRRTDPLQDIPMRVTYRTMRVLSAIGARPGSSNREIGDVAGIVDQGQISKLLARLERLGLIANEGAGQSEGLPNSWTLSAKGVLVERAAGTSSGAER